MEMSKLDYMFSLTYFFPLFLFYTPWKDLKTFGFWIFLGGLKSQHREEMV